MLAALIIDVGNKRHDRSRRSWKRLWRRHVARNGCVPLILHCGECEERQKKSEKLVKARARDGSSKTIRDELIHYEETEVLDQIDRFEEDGDDDDDWF